MVYSAPMHATASLGRLRPLGSLAVAALITLSGCATGSTGSKHAVSAGGVDPVLLQLVRNEQINQQLEHDMVDMQLAAFKGQMQIVEGFWHPRSLRATPFPSERASDAQPVSKGHGFVESRAWAVDHDVRPMDPAAVAASMEGFLSQFGAIDDLRFKLANAVPSSDGRRIDGYMKIRVVGRAADGRPEWVRGKAKISAEAQRDGPWQLTRFEIKSLDSMLAARPIFEEIALPAGVEAPEGLVDYSSPPASGLLFEYANNGMVSVSDVDRDGRMDFLVTSLATTSALYLNKGDGFALWAPEPRDPLLSASWGGVFFDHDNDGDADYFHVDLADDTPALLHNELVESGKLGFTPHWRAKAAIRKPVLPALNAFSGLAVADVNADQVPDVLVLLWADERLPNNVNKATNGGRNLLFVSQADGSYAEVGEAWGVAGHHFSHAAQFVDIDGDGRMDVYVANDFSGGNFLLLNRGDHFEDVTAAYGLEDRGWAMGVAFGDYDNDGDLDLHVSRMSSTVGERVRNQLSDDDVPDMEQLKLIGDGNKVYDNRGDGTFVEAARLPASWSYGGGFIDVDNDGWLDVIAPNGNHSAESMHDT